MAGIVTDAAVESAYQAYCADTRVSIHDGLRNALEAAAPLLGPRPLLDRESVTAAIRAEVASYGITPSTAEPKAVDAVMKLARPMPTREQIAETLVGVIPDVNEGINLRLVVADAVLALLDGGE